MKQLAAALSCVLIFHPFGGARAQEAPSADAVVDSIEQVTGLHKGLRRNHGKGFCGEGLFQANAEAAKVSSSPLFSGAKIPALFRLSLAGPNPAAPDAARSPRGLAVQFTLPNGALHDMAMLNAPLFSTANVRTFLERQQADAWDPSTGKPDPEKQKAFFANHPEAKALADWLKSYNPPPSYAETAYYSIHAFKFIDSAKHESWVKWRFAPRDGVKNLTAEEMAAAPHDFLEQKLTERLKAGPVIWDMIVSFGEASDPIDNPTVVWPAERREVIVGALTLTKAGAASAGSCEDVIFDPTLVSPGVEISPDPILAFRSSAYAVSFGRRLGEKAQ